MTSTTTELEQAIAAFGHRFDPEVVKSMRQLIGPLHQRDNAGIDIQRDLYYGTHERHRLDVFKAQSVTTLQPALIFVHGGGFVAGDKNSADGFTFYDNVGRWAVEHGMVGINITYRLAPAHPWPCGVQDVAAAVAWVHAHAQDHGIDPSRIILMGQSAGAVHVASYVAHSPFHQIPGSGLRAAILLSGLYDMQIAADNPPKAAYFGTDPGTYGERSSLYGLLNATVPLMIAVNELDPKDFEQQALLLVNALFEQRGALPYFVQLKAHNHLSSILALNLPQDSLGAELHTFITRILK